MSAIFSGGDLEPASGAGASRQQAIFDCRGNGGDSPKLGGAPGENSHGKPAAATVGPGSRAELVMKLDELEKALLGNPGSAQDMLASSLAGLDAALRAWRDGHAAKAISAQSNALETEGDGKMSSPSAPASGSEASANGPAMSAGGARGAQDALSGGWPGDSQECKAPDLTAESRGQWDHLLRELKLSLFALAAAHGRRGSAPRPQGQHPGGTARRSAPEEDRGNSLARQIEAAHRRLSAQIEAGLSAAAAQVSALREQIGQAQAKAPGEGQNDGGAADGRFEIRLAGITERLDQLSAKLAPLAALEQAIGEVALRLEKLFAVIESRHSLAQGESENLTRFGEAAQDILEEVASLRGAQQESARHAGAAFAAINGSLEQIQSLCSRFEPPGFALGGSPWEDTLDASDPFVPILSHIKQHSEGNLAAKVRAEAQLAEKNSVQNGEAKQLKPPEAATLAGPDSFLIEPGLGFGPAAHPPEPASEDVKDTASVALEQAGSSDLVAAARRAARQAQLEQNRSRPGCADKKRSPILPLLSKVRHLTLSHKRLAVIGASLFLAALGAVALEQAFVQFRLGDSLAGFLRRWHESAKLERRAAEGNEPKAGALAVMTSGGAAAAKPGPRRPADAASTPVTVPAGASLDLLAPAQAPVSQSGGSQLPPKAQSIAGSDAILGTALAAPSGAGPARPAAGPANAFAPAGVPESIKRRAASGNAAAQFELAAVYAEGRAASRDYALAALWYGKAAAQGHPVAQYRLGSLYEKGLGVGKDQQRAKELYERAAESGNIRAMHNLGVLAAEGDGGKPNYTSAALWFAKAAEYGIRDSQYNLAVLLARGLGAPKDLVKSYTWFAIVAKAGDREALRRREEIAARLTASELAAADAAAAAFGPREPEASANEPPPPQASAKAPSGEPSGSRKVSGL